MYRTLGCGCLRRKKRVKLQACTLFALLFAAAASGALVTWLVYQLIVARVRLEVEFGSKRLLRMQADLDEVQVQVIHVNHQLRMRSGNASSIAPDYATIDRVIDDPPNDTVVRSLYYELAYASQLALLVAFLFFT